MSDITERIGKLLAQAENPAATDAERETYLTKAQTLATAYSIDLEIARQRQADKTKRETPTHRRIYLSDLGVTARQGLHHYVRLFLALADVNDVDCNIAHNSTYVIPFGFPSDIEVTERLFASLVVQMVIACNDAIKSGEHKVDRYWVESYFDSRTCEWKGGHYRNGDARIFKASFYEAFTSKVVARLRAAKREQAEKSVLVTDDETGETTSTTGALVLRQKVDDVKDYYKQNSKAKGSWRGGSLGSRGHSSSGAVAGHEAGSNARLGAPSALANRTAVSS